MRERQVAKQAMGDGRGVRRALTPGPAPRGHPVATGEGRGIPATPIAPRLAQRAPALARNQGTLLFVGGTLVFVLVAAWLSFGVRLAVGDALSRTLSAVRVEHSRSPRLAAIGFVWPPLPTLAQLPLVLWPQLGFYGFSGGIVSALATGGLLATLNRLLRWANVTAWWRGLLLVLFALNPMLLFYAGNGMSELPFLFFFTVASFAFVRWQVSTHWRDLIVGGLATACMFGCRYDAIPYAAAFAAAVCLVFLVGERRFNPSRVEANLFAYLVPVAYAVGMWLYFNYLIEGDPLYFARNPYSNSFIVRNVASNAAVLALQGSWLTTGLFLIKTMLGLSPLLLTLLGVALFVILRQRNVGVLSVLMVLLVVPAFQLWSYRSGQTFGFLRFFLSMQPAGLLLAATLLQRSTGSARTALLALSAVGLLLGIWTTAAAMEKGGPGGIFADQVVFEETDFLGALRHPTTPIDNYAAARVAASVLRTRFAGQAVTIMGDISIDEVVLFSAMPQKFIGPSDPDFDQALQSPTAYADYLLTMQVADADPRYMALRQVYPHVYEAGIKGYTLDQQIGPYRLYRRTGGSS